MKNFTITKISTFNLKAPSIDFCAFSRQSVNLVTLSRNWLILFCPALPIFESSPQFVCFRSAGWKKTFISSATPPRTPFLVASIWLKSMSAKFRVVIGFSLFNRTKKNARPIKGSSLPVWMIRRRPVS